MNKLIEKIKNSKLINSLEVDNKKLLLIFLLSAVVLYVDFTFILKAQFAGLSRVSVELAKSKSDLAGLEKDLKNMQDLKAKKAIPSQAAQVKAKRFITEGQVSTLLQDISNLANDNDVRILQVKPTREPRPSADTKFNPGPAFSPLYILLDLTAGYHQLGKFINDLENSQALIMVQEIKIEAQKDNYFKQKAAVTLKTYVKK